jgi:hypothetical protein
MQDLDVIDLDMPSAGVIEISSSCDLSIFPSKADPPPPCQRWWGCT